MSSSLSVQRRFPATRLRRLRRYDALRRLVAETQLSPADLILPLFVQEGEGSSPIPGFYDVARHGLDALNPQVEQALGLGIRIFALFPQVPASRKSENCEEAWREDNLVNRAFRQLSQRFPEALLIGDVALDPYSASGHDGFLREDGQVDNDSTLDALVKQALAQAAAGCHILAPSDMMDGRIGAIRAALEADGFQDSLLLSYSAKYASAFYGPFRDAVGSRGQLKGDKRGYQMDPANSAEALRETEMDLSEGADLVMVKPGLPYLDIVTRIKAAFAVPTFAYQVSGEYAMLQAGIEAGLFDPRQATLELLLAFKRAGADGVLTYGATKAARWLAEID